MPQEAGQPGTPEHQAQGHHEHEVKALKKRIAELEDQLANYKQSGHAGPTHASSAALENYPQVPPQGEPQPEEPPAAKQPQSGAAATAQEKA